VVGVDLDGSWDSELERRREDEGSDGMERWRVGSRPRTQVDGGSKEMRRVAAGGARS
jgi:hypothetical protein